MSSHQTDRYLPSPQTTSPQFTVYVLIGWFSPRCPGWSSRVVIGHSFPLVCSPTFPQCVSRGIIFHHPCTTTSFVQVELNTA